MANVLIYKIQFLDSNPFGEFVAGDLIEIFYDASLDPTPVTGGTTGITVTKNGVSAVSGADIDQFAQSYKTEQNQFYNICNSGDLVLQVRNTSFPYLTTYLIPDWPSCAVTPTTCDLMFVGEPAVTLATTLTTADGEITVSASSSETIEYKLGSDFLYGAGQSSPTFSALLPGSYRIYARDENNCSANVFVTVGYENEYGTIHQIEYYVNVGDQQVSQTKIEIQERDYSGDYTEYKAGPSPIEIALRGDGEIDKFMSVMATNANITLMSETSFQYVHLVSGDDEKYRVVYSKNFGSGYEIIWTGKIVQQTYQEPYISPPYEVRFTCNDGLPDLDKKTYCQPDGLPYSGRVKAIQLISECLKKTGVPLNIRVACNLYATGMDSTDADDPLDQAYVDVFRFYLLDDAPTYLFVLQTILESFGARLIQWENRWNITRVEELRAAYDWREFDFNGNYTSNGATDPIIERVPPLSPGVWFRDEDQNLEIIKGYGKVRLNYNLGLVKNIFRNGDFTLKSVYNELFNAYSLALNMDGFTVVNGAYGIFTSYERIDNNNIALIITGDEDTDGSAYVGSATYNVRMGASNGLAIKIRYKIPQPIVSVPYVRVNIEVRYGAYWLTSQGKWTTVGNAIKFYVTEFDKYIESEVIAEQPDSGAVAGYDLNIRVYHAWVYSYEHDGTTDLKTKVTTTVPQGIRTEMHANAGTFYVGESIMYYELEENTDAESLPDIVRPTDYHATTNPVQWILKKRIYPEILDPVTVQAVNRSFFIDKISVGYLDSGNDVTDVITLDKSSQVNSDSVYEKTIYLGSLVETVTTKPVVGLSLSLFDPPTLNLTLITQNVLSANLTYTGYFSDVDGVGFVNWVRDGFDESRLLHQIHLLSMSGQYKRSIKRLSGSFISDQFIGPLHTIQETFDDDVLYIPMGVTYRDIDNSFSGEFCELIDVEAEPISGFSSGFVIAAFGSNAFN